jgi:hypothetical protein
MELQMGWIKRHLNWSFLIYSALVFAAMVVVFSLEISTFANLLALGLSFCALILGSAWILKQKGVNLAFLWFYALGGWPGVLAVLLARK